MENQEDDLLLYTTTSGRLKQFFFRWKPTLIAAASIIAAAALFLTLAGTRTSVSGDENQVTQVRLLGASGPPPPNTFVIVNGTLSYFGDESKFDLRKLDLFPGLPTPESMKGFDPSTIRSMELKWVKINGTEFSMQLLAFRNLQTLHLNNITTSEFLTPVPLPSLKEFALYQGIEQEEETLRGLDYQIFTNATPWLHSTLFFANDNSTDFAPKLAKQSDRNITVFFKGSIIYQVDKGNREVRISLPKCREILDGLKARGFVYTKLTLGRCQDILPTTISSAVTYLNLYIMPVNSTLLPPIIRPLKNLQEFYAELPGYWYVTDVNVADFAPSLRVLSISSMTISADPGFVAGNIREFSFGSLNQYGWVKQRVTDLSTEFVQNFTLIFPNVQRVGLFDLNAGRYPFAKEVMKSSAQSIIIEGFERPGQSENSTVNEDPAEVDDVEKFFTKLNVPTDSKYFAIEKDVSGRPVARDLEFTERLWLRYKMLGWDTIDSWGKFQYVQSIVAGGGILG